MYEMQANIGDAQMYISKRKPKNERYRRRMYASHLPAKSSSPSRKNVWEAGEALVSSVTLSGKGLWSSNSLMSCSSIIGTTWWGKSSSFNSRAAPPLAFTDPKTTGTATFNILHETTRVSPSRVVTAKKTFARLDCGRVTIRTCVWQRREGGDAFAWPPFCCCKNKAKGVGAMWLPILLSFSP